METKHGGMSVSFIPHLSMRIPEPSSESSSLSEPHALYTMDVRLASYAFVSACAKDTLLTDVLHDVMGFRLPSADTFDPPSYRLAHEPPPYSARKHLTSSAPPSPLVSSTISAPARTSTPA